MRNIFLGRRGGEACFSVNERVTGTSHHQQQRNLLAVAEGTSDFDLKIIFCFKEILVVVPMVNAAQECSRQSDLQPAPLINKS